MDIWIRVIEKRVDQIDAKYQTDDGGIDVPASKDMFDLRVDLLKQRSRAGCHNRYLQVDLLWRFISYHIISYYVMPFR